MKAEIKGTDLIITIPVNAGFPNSKSGKTKIVASSNGNITTALQIEHAGEKKNVTIGLNAYFKP